MYDRDLFDLLRQEEVTKVCGLQYGIYPLCASYKWCDEKQSEAHPSWYLGSVGERYGFEFWVFVCFLASKEYVVVFG